MKKIMIWESIQGSLMTFFFLFLWIAMFIIMVQAIKKDFLNSPFYSVMIIIAMLIMSGLTKIIPNPIITYEEKIELEEKEGTKNDESM